MSRLRQYYRTVYGALLLGTAVTLLVLLVLQNLPFLANTEYSAYDYQFWRRTTIPISQNIVIVAMDDTSFHDLSKGDVRVPRRYMAQVITFLHKAGARAIGVDFVFDAPSDRKNDTALVTALRQAGNVVVAALFPGADADIHLATESTLDVPIDSVASAAAGWGVVNYPYDQDNTLRRLVPVLHCPGGSGPAGVACPSFPLELASIVLHKPWQQVLRGVPNPMLINYLGPQPALNPSQFAYHPYQFESVANGEDDPALFRNKIVLVIPDYLLAKDLFNTPYGQMYGGVVHANALNTILSGNYITPAGSNANNLLILIVGLITTIIASRFGIFRSAFGAALVFVGYAVISLFLFDHARIWIDLVIPETTVVLVFAAIMSLRFATEERQRRRTSKIFGQYVKPEIVDILVSAPDEEKALAGARRPISVLFVDIRGFTRMSESMEPEDVVRALDVYLEELTASVQDYDGTIDKYVGDELMALWNAPNYQEDHALRAVLSGLDMVARMDRINEQLRAKNLPLVKYGIGINSGDAVVGQMGSSFRKQYDVIGDTVNTAARLCSAAGGAEIIIGEETWEMIGDRLEVEETEPLALKGKSRAFRTFRVLGLKPAGAEAPEAVPAPA